MDNKTLKTAIDRVRNGEAQKAEIEVLIRWAEKEIFEWESFKVMCEEKLSQLTQQ